MPDDRTEPPRFREPTTLAGILLLRVGVYLVLFTLAAGLFALLDGEPLPYVTGRGALRFGAAVSAIALFSGAASWAAARVRGERWRAFLRGIAGMCFWTVGGAPRLAVHGVMRWVLEEMLAAIVMGLLVMPILLWSSRARARVAARHEATR